MSKPQTRKANRLKCYDYSQNGAYFVTICAKSAKEIFSKIVPGVGNDVHIAPKLSQIGEVIDSIIRELPKHRSDIIIDEYVIMPNHLHIIVCIQRSVGGDVHIAPKTPRKKDDVDIVPYGVSDFVRTLKITTTKRIGFSPWQRSFHDRIIRDQNEYYRISEYIQNNPMRWEEDCYYGGDVHDTSVGGDVHIAPNSST